MSPQHLAAHDGHSCVRKQTLHRCLRRQSPPAIAGQFRQERWLSASLKLQTLGSLLTSLGNVSVNTSIEHPRAGLHTTLQPNWAQEEFQGKSPKETQSLIRGRGDLPCSGSNPWCRCFVPKVVIHYDSTDHPIIRNHHWLNEDWIASCSSKNIGDNQTVPIGHSIDKKDAGLVVDIFI